MEPIQEQATDRAQSRSSVHRCKLGLRIKWVTEDAMTLREVTTFNLGKRSTHPRVIFRVHLLRETHPD